MPTKAAIASTSKRKATTIVPSGRLQVVGYKLKEEGVAKSLQRVTHNL